MATLSDMIDEVRSSLAGYTLRQDRITYLNAAINTTDLAIQVGSSANLAKGIVEIDNELIWVDNFTKSTNTLNAAPGFGRGFQNTAAAPHAQYAQVLFQTIQVATQLPLQGHKQCGPRPTLRT